MGTADWRVERIAALPGWTTGMAVTGDGRVFVSAPQAMQPASMPTLGELIDGSLRPFRPGSAESFARPSVSSGGGHRPPPTNQHARSKHEPDIR